MPRLPDFAELKSMVFGQVMNATNAQILLTEIVTPIRKQPLLFEHFPFIVNTLINSLEGHVLMTVCRMFEPSEDPRHASLSNFLRSIEQHHAATSDNPPPEAIEARRRYEQEIPTVLGDVASRWPTLAIHRSAYLAHRDLSKKHLPSLTYAYVRECPPSQERVWTSPTCAPPHQIALRIPRKIKALPLLLAGRANGSGDGTGTEGSTVRYGHSTVRAGNGTRSENPTRQNRQNSLGESRR